MQSLVLDGMAGLMLSEMILCGDTEDSAKRVCVVGHMDEITAAAHNTKPFVVFKTDGGVARKIRYEPSASIVATAVSHIQVGDRLIVLRNGSVEVQRD
jgi:putative aminopeptidase FrvX